MKHNKIKNTGLIFELLSRAMVHESLNGSDTALKIIRTHFNKKSELLKELRLYQLLSTKTEHNASDLLDLAISGRKRLNESALFKEKYSLLKSIKKQYNIQSFFNSRVTNYKLQASIYKLFEYNAPDRPDDYLGNKKIVLEVLSGAGGSVIDEVEQAWRDIDPELRKIGFKILIERFNEKYKELNPRQRNLLAKYITEDNESDVFKDYVYQEVGYIGRSLTEKMDTVKNAVTKAKLSECINLLQSIISAKQIKEDHLSSMLKYYELIEEID